MSQFADAITTDSLPDEVVELLNESAGSSGLVVLLSKLLNAYRSIGNGLRDGAYSSTTVGTQNSFGDHQLDVDLKTDEVMMRNLRDSGLVHIAASEENPVETECGGTGFSVAFDPLDGSSIVDANFAVGTITAIFPGRGLMHRVGKEQVAAMIAQYGPRVTVALGLSGLSTATGEGHSLELTMLPDRWIVSMPKLQIAKKAKTFAPGNLRATFDNPKYQTLVMYWIEKKYTLRYSGGLVPDVYHILIKGEGVLANASSPSAKAKLRLLFEAIPIALIIESAEGSSCVCPSEAGESIPPISLLEVPVSDMDKRVGVCFGSMDEVERFKSLIFA